MDHNLRVFRAFLKIRFLTFESQSKKFKLFNSPFPYNLGAKHQRWSREHKTRGQSQGRKTTKKLRPRTALSRTDPLEAQDRNVRGPGLRNQAQVSNKKFRNFFQAISKKSS